MNKGDLIDKIAAENGGAAAGDVLVVNARVTPSLRQRADAFTAMVGKDTEYPDIKVTSVEVDISNALADAQAKVEQAFKANQKINGKFLKKTRNIIWILLFLNHPILL